MVTVQPDEVVPWVEHCSHDVNELSVRLRTITLGVRRSDADSIQQASESSY